MKFLLDVCVSSRSFTAFLAAQGHDVVSALAIDPSASDEQLLALALQEELRDMIAVELDNVRLARMMYDARNQAGLTQKQLAKAVGTTQSVISRLEDADYEGNSLNMLHRIAAALNKRIDIRFLSLKRTPQHAWRRPGRPFMRPTRSVP